VIEGGPARSSGGGEIEPVVLEVLLALHPAQLTVEELVRELEAEEAPAGWDGRPAVEEAVRDLIAAGLLLRHGPFVVPTRAALRFDQLLGG
jgi:hypothetical protein